MLIKSLQQKGFEVLPVEGTQEIRLQCPNCQQQKLKSDDFKLYFNQVRKVGHCKRCEWVGGLAKLLKILKLKKLTISAPSLEELKSELSRNGQRTQQSLESVLPRKVVPAWRNRRSRHYLRKRGFSKSSTEQYGFLYCYRGYFQNRLILPIFNEHGKYRTFAARFIPYFIAERYLHKRARSGPEKYLYPKGFHVSRLLYGLHSNKKKKRQRFVILVEGIFDAIHLAPYGIAVLGSNLSWNQINLLREAGIKRVVICFDHDRKRKARDNIRASIKRAKSKLRKYFDVGVIELPNRGSDPTDYPKKKILKWAERSFL